MNIARENCLGVFLYTRCKRDRKRCVSASLLFSIVMLLLGGVFSSSARAQESDDLVSRNTSYDSPERFALELKIGPYVPDVDDPAYDEIYRGDSGLMLGLEFEVIAFRLKNILYLDGGAGIGYADYTGPAREVGTEEETDEEANFDIIPLSLRAVLRVDALARLLDIPFIFTGKLGYAWFVWDDEKGDEDIADGISHGLVWAGQAALDLDFFDRAAARMLDDEWGINHSFLFFEVYGVNTREGLELDETTWSVGLGFVM